MGNSLSFYSVKENLVRIIVPKVVNIKALKQHFMYIHFNNTIKIYSHTNMTWEKGQQEFTGICQIKQKKSLHSLA